MQKELPDKTMYMIIKELDARNMVQVICSASCIIQFIEQSSTDLKQPLP